MNPSTPSTILPPPSTLHLPPSPRPSLLPDRMKQPFMVLWLWVIPQIGLLLLNLRAWSLAAGEATVPQAHAAAWLGAAQVALLAVGVALWLVPRLRGRAVGLPSCGVGLLLSIGYLWLFFAQFDKVWPRAVAEWMLPQTEIVFYQFALVMPALFYCGLRLACVELRLQRGVDIGVSFGMFVAIPLAWYILFHIIELLTHRFFRGSMESVAIIFFAGSTVLVMMAFLRLLYFLYTWLAAQSWGQTAMTAIAGLLCPIGGLLLNIAIPFPCDFQSVGIYALAVLNGLVLIAPLPRHPALALLLWWARSALYMFTLYFFIVFLPFLPLSLLAMLACGAGFLILAPTLLFIIHTRRLSADAATLTAARGRGPVLALFLAGLVTIPAGFTGLACLDRQALTSAMDVVFSPDLRQTRVSLHPLIVEHGLNRLRDMKDGLYLPFLSDAYNRLVFNGMVLPDDKVETLSRALLGKPARPPNKSDRFSLFLAPRSMSRWGGGANRALPPRNVSPRPPLPPETVVSNGVRRSTVKLELVNNGPGNSEFVGTLAIPDGVLVSGFWLDVAGKRKPGLIVEKKTALWVYHMIRDYTRRDPGLLVYEPDGNLRLSVFPFAGNETRTVWLEFTSPATWAPAVTLGSTPIPLIAEPQAAGVEPCRVPAAAACVIPGAALGALPQSARAPIVRFIIDRSAAAATNVIVIPPALSEAATRLGGRCRVTFANIESLDDDVAPESPGEAVDLARTPTDALPARCGFAPDRAMARLLLDAATGGAMVPVFVVIPAPGSTPVRTLDLRPFGRLTPDVPAYYLWSNDHLDRVSFADGTTQRVDTIDAPAPVVLFRAGTRVTAVTPGAAGAVVEALGTAEAPLDVYNPDSGAFEALPVMPALDDPAYAAGLRLQLDSHAVRLDPAALDARLPELVARSRAAGILCPFTSFMVVENSAQEQTLAARQKQALGAHHALEFEETVKSPEPGALWLLPVVLVLGWWLRRARTTALIR